MIINDKWRTAKHLILELGMLLNVSGFSKK